VVYLLLSGDVLSRRGCGLKTYEIRLCPDVVDRLRRLARELSYRRNQDWSWCDLVRLGAEWVLDSQGERPTPPMRGGETNENEEGAEK
jgi:hypothetical protein